MARKVDQKPAAGWAEQLKVLQADIEAMPPGPERDAAQKRADQLKNAIQMDGWLKADLNKPT